jgi:hypothetical protein
MSAQTGPTIIKDGLVLALDAADLGSYPGAGTVWSDLSGNTNNGTLTNGPTFDANNGGSVVFDGVDDYTLLGSSVTLGNTFTINAFVKLAGSNPNGVIVGTDANGSDNWFGIDSNLIHAFYTQTADINNAVTYGATTLSYNRWYYLSMVVNGSTVTVYLNGILDGSSTQSFTIGSWNGNYAIGRRSSSVASRYFYGNIANVTFYNRVLTAKEILQNYNALKPRFKLN